MQSVSYCVYDTLFLSAAATCFVISARETARRPRARKGVRCYFSARNSAAANTAAAADAETAAGTTPDELARSILARFKLVEVVEVVELVVVVLVDVLVVLVDVLVDVVLVDVLVVLVHGVTGSKHSQHAWFALAFW